MNERKRKRERKWKKKREKEINERACERETLVPFLNVENVHL